MGHQDLFDGQNERDEAPPPYVAMTWFVVVDEMFANVNLPMKFPPTLESHSQVARVLHDFERKRECARVY